MSNGKKKKKYHQIPDDLPPDSKRTRKQRNREKDPTQRMRDDIRSERRVKMHYATNPTAKKIVKARKIAKKGIVRGIDAIVKPIVKTNRNIVDKREKARKKRETDARAQREANLLRGMDTVKKQKRKSGQGG